MARRYRKQQQNTTAASVGAAAADGPATKRSEPSDHFRHLLLGLAAAFLVARPLVPSDSGPWIGDGQVAAALWIALAALWGVQSLARPRLRVRFGGIEAAMVAFVGWWSAAALIGAARAAPRPSINMLWEGVAALLTFLLLRQLVEPGEQSVTGDRDDGAERNTGRASGTREMARTGGTGSASGTRETAGAGNAGTPLPKNSGREARAMVAVMIAVGVVLAITALYQYFVTMPATRQQFVEHPDATFREAQLDVPAPGTQAYRSFADRLNSPEPFATFNLTNSLAAYLAPWLVVALGLGALGWQLRPPQPRSGRLDRLRIVACAVPIAVALALTRSRSAWIGAAVGLACVAAWRFFANRRAAGSEPNASPEELPTRSARGGRWAALIVAVVVAAAGIAIVARPHLLEPAVRSFQVRLDYWRATCHMIADRPWWGVGPGNFGDFYTQYRLPTAFEDVRDPHNFALEIAANAGLPALLLFLVVLIGFANRFRRRDKLGLAGLEPTEERTPLPASDGAHRATTESAATPRFSDGTWWIFCGALVGFWLAPRWNLLLGFSAWEEDAAVRMVAAAATWWLLWPWIQNGRLSPRLCGIGVLVLLVALLAVGGITFGGVNETLWLLLALGLNAVESRSAHAHSGQWAWHSATTAAVEPAENADGKRSLPWIANVVLLIAVLGLWITQYLSAYEPVLVCQGELDAARSFAADGNDSQQEQHLIQAAEADPYAVEPRRELALLRFGQWLRGDEKGHRGSQFTSRMIGDFENWMNQALKLEPQSASLRGEAGSIWQAIFEISRVPADGRKAVELCRQAAGLYPTGVAIQFQLAQTLALTGGSAASKAAAKAAAREALRLDKLRPEAERALNDEQRKLAERIISGDTLPIGGPPPVRLGPPLPPPMAPSSVPRKSR